MKNILLISTLLILLSFKLMAQADVSKARRMGSGIVIDGNDKDWTKPLNFYDDASGLMFAIGNDDDHLYLCFTENDEFKMKKLMSAGWTIGLSSKEKNKKFKAELQFPGINVMGFRKGGNNFEKKSTADNLMTFYPLQLKSVSVKGFKSGISEVALQNKSGINIGIGSDSIQHIVYEIAIPLSEISIPDLTHPEELITLNVSVNALERPSGGGGGGRSGGHSGMGGGGRSGGGMSGMGGGRRGGGHGGSQGGGMYHQGESGGMNNGLEKVSFKQKFKLAEN
jgi:hypothetical protein